MSKARKHRLFSIGAEAAHHVARTADIYFCPICASGFARSALESGELTLEHIPPAALGGRPIALTCRRCNTTAGHTVDIHMIRRTEFMSFLHLLHGRRTDYSARATFEVDGSEISADLSQSEDAIVIRPIAASSDPAALRAVDQHFSSRASGGKSADGEAYRLTPRVRYHSRLSMIGDLRVAFLAAFALFGYRYALNPRLDIVRRQLLEPGATVIKNWSLHFDEDSQPENVIAVVPDQPSIVVKRGPVGVLLPWLTTSPAFYEDIDSMVANRARFTATGMSFSWPTRLQMRLDMPSRY